MLDEAVHGDIVLHKDTLDVIQDKVLLCEVILAEIVLHAIYDCHEYIYAD